jgi:hypothetical protein
VDPLRLCSEADAAGPDPPISDLYRAAGESWRAAWTMHDPSLLG